MDRSENVASPFTAATEVVPLKVPALGLVPKATAMLADELVTVLLRLSRTATLTAGEIVAPATAVLGWTVNSSLVAVPGVMLNVLLGAPVRPVLEAASV